MYAPGVSALIAKLRVPVEIETKAPLETPADDLGRCLDGLFDGWGHGPAELFAGAYLGSFDVGAAGRSSAVDRIGLLPVGVVVLRCDEVVVRPGSVGSGCAEKGFAWKM